MGGAVMRKLLLAMSVAAAISRTNDPRKAQRKEEK
jgi:hypothetical protein